MESIIVDSKPQFVGRKEAGLLLSRRLMEYRNSNSIVVGIPHGGVCVASAIAQALSLPLEVMPCRKIKDPGDSLHDIGSVSAHEVFVHDCARTIPQDYINHQIILLKNAIASESKKYYGETRTSSFFNRTVILVDDLVRSSDSMIACLREIGNAHPLKVVVAVPVISEQAMKAIRNEADDVIFLRIASSIQSAKDYFLQYPRIDAEAVSEILRASRLRHTRNTAGKAQITSLENRT